MAHGGRAGGRGWYCEEVVCRIPWAYLLFYKVKRYLELYHPALIIWEPWCFYYRIFKLGLKYREGGTCCSIPLRVCLCSGKPVQAPGELLVPFPRCPPHCSHLLSRDQRKISYLLCILLNSHNFCCLKIMSAPLSAPTRRRQDSILLVPVPSVPSSVSGASALSRGLVK